MNRLYLDLDGVLADFDRHFADLFHRAPGSMPDEAMWTAIHARGDFFRTMPPCPGAVEFFAEARKLSPHVAILTACPKSDYARCATQKREWVREHLGADVTVLPVAGGSSKPLFMHAPGDVLLDDFKRNTRAWARAGGRAILHVAYDLPGSLRKLHHAFGFAPHRHEGEQ